MWPLFDRGYFDTIGTDHCPITKEEKEKGLKCTIDAPAASPHRHVPAPHAHRVTTADDA